MKKPLPATEQKMAAEKIMTYIVADACPLSTVDSIRFRDMVFTLNNRFKMFSRKTLAKMIQEDFKKCKEELINTLSKVEVVCLTADIWSARNRSFLGATLHWLDHVTFVRHSRAIALKRFRGSFPA